MYTEDKIFGPLTFRQFLCAAAGIGLFYLLRSQISEQYLVITTTILALATIAAIFRFQPKKIENIEEYYATKKMELTPSEYQKMLQKQHAEVLSQIHTRKEKGFSDDPKLLERAAQIEKEINR